MKKTVFILVIVLLLVLCGCEQKSEVTQALPSQAPQPESVPAAEAPAEPVAEAVAEPAAEAEAEPAAETEAGTVKSLRLFAVIDTLHRGDMVDVIAEAKEGYEDFMIVKAGEKYGLVDRQFLLMEGEADYAAWTGYAQGQAGLYGSCFPNGEALLTVAVNTELKVLDEFNDCYLVEYRGGEYAVSKELVGRTRVTGGGDNSKGGSSGGKDGGDINLPLACFVDQSGEASGRATIRMNGTPLILGIYDRGEELEILQRDEKTCRLLVFGMEAEAESRFVRPEGEEEYEAWTGYSTSGAKLYDNPWLFGTGTKLNLNTEFEVLEELGGCYLVRIGGREAYISVEGLSAERNPSGGGNSKNGGSGSDPWTEPAL